MINSNKELSNFMVDLREQERFHKEYEGEFAFYEIVKSGDVNGLEPYFYPNITDEMSGYGKLSENPLKNMTYHFVILAAMLTRFCIEGGMEHEQAYSLSDIYIRAVDHCKSITEIQEFHREMICDFTTRMKQIQKKKKYSKHIIICLDWIEKTLHQRITIKELSEKVGIHVTYLSKLFQAETGYSLSEYILREKVKKSEDLLIYTNKSYSEIAELFCFSSQSHFIKVFSKYTGVTPSAYKKEYFRHHLSATP